MFAVFNCIALKRKISMKKTNAYKLLIIVLCVLIVSIIVFFTVTFNNHIPKGEMVVLNCDGKEMARYDSNANSLIFKNNNYADFIHNVIEEATITLSMNEKKIFNSKIIIKTYFDDQIFNIIENRLNNENYDDEKTVEVAIVSIDGKLLSSIAKGKSVDVVSESHKAGSAIKPLSVYAPALEYGFINWSTSIKDLPFKVVQESNNTRNWPANYEGVYLNKEVTLQHAIKHSLNTTSVWVLDELTPKVSCEFLQKLDIDVSYESEYANGPLYEEIYGNLALGELKNGIKTETLATAYQIFANGGSFTHGTSIKDICCEGKVLYKDEFVATQIIEVENSEIMNLLLQGVVDKGGTGEKAKIDNLKIAGKTGTSQGYKDNWFVGMSPDYVCAVWYGYNQEKENRSENISTSIFRDIFLQLKHNTNEYPQSPALVEKMYCIYTGELATDRCKKTDIGYFSVNKIPQECTKH